MGHDHRRDAHAAALVRTVGTTRVGEDGGWELSALLVAGAHELTATEAGGDGIASAASAPYLVTVPARW